MAHLFISYATDDQAVAQDVCARLEAQDIACWIAPRDVAPGARWDEAIVDAITGAGAFLLLLTATSNESPFVANEVNHAFAAKKTIFTFRAENVAPSKSLGFYLARHHWTDGFPLGFKRSSQRGRVSLSLNDFEVPLQAFSNRVFFAADC